MQIVATAIVVAAQARSHVRHAPSIRPTRTVRVVRAAATVRAATKRAVANPAARRATARRAAAATRRSAGRSPCVAKSLTTTVDAEGLTTTAATRTSRPMNDPRDLSAASRAPQCRSATAQSLALHHARNAESRRQSDANRRPNAAPIPRRATSDQNRATKNAHHHAKNALRHARNALRRVKSVRRLHPRVRSGLRPRRVRNDPHRRRARIVTPSLRSQSLRAVALPSTTEVRSEPASRHERDALTSSLAARTRRLKRKNPQ